MARSIKEINEWGKQIVNDYCSPSIKKASEAHARNITDPQSEDYDDMVMQELIEIDDCLFENLVAGKVIAFCMGYKAAMKEVKTLTDKSL